MIGLLSSAFSPPVAKSQMDRNQIMSGSFATRREDGHTKSEFVLVSWNIERGVRWSKILQALQGPLAADLYVLQEVDLHTRRTGYQDVAADLARETGTSYVFGIEFEELAQGRKGLPAFHGQAVLSRHPISRARILRFRHQPHDWGPWWKPSWAWAQPRRGGRMALVSEIQLGAQQVVIYNVHLESQTSDAGRARQMDEILQDIREHYSYEAQVIVAGDLNTQKGADSVVLQELKAAGFRDIFENREGPLGTKPRTNRRKDWVFLRNLHSSDARIAPIVISDHYPLRVRISTQPSGSVRSSRVPLTAKP